VATGDIDHGLALAPRSFRRWAADHATALMEGSTASTRRKFSREFKLEAVRLVTSGGRGMVAAARDLEVRPDMLRRWKRQLEEDPVEAFPEKGNLKPDEDQIRRLQRELARVKEERDILTKVVAIFSVPSR
jgi:transposase